MIDQPDGPPWRLDQLDALVALTEQALSLLGDPAEAEALLRQIEQGRMALAPCFELEPDGAPVASALFFRFYVAAPGGYECMFQVGADVLDVSDEQRAGWLRRHLALRDAGVPLDVSEPEQRRPPSRDAPLLN